MPGFLTQPIPVQQVAAAVIAGIENRSARIGAPGWVLPMLRIRGLVTTVMDEVLIRNRALAKVVSDAESRH